MPDRPDPWPWPAELDGPAAAPSNHWVLFENDRVRVLETLIRAGETTPVHTHASPTVTYVISGSGFRRRDESGTIVLDTQTAEPPFAMPPVLWSEFIPSHTLENTGPDDLHLIGIELKDPA